MGCGFRLSRLVAVIPREHSLMEYQGLVHNYSGLLACRFFLGLVEGLMIAGHHPRHLLLVQAVFFPESSSISLSSIPERGFRYGANGMRVVER